MFNSLVNNLVSSLWVTEGHHGRYQQVTLKVAPVGDPRDCHGITTPETVMVSHWRPTKNLSRVKKKLFFYSFLSLILNFPNGARAWVLMGAH